MASWGRPTAPSLEKYWLRPSNPNRPPVPSVYTPVMPLYSPLLTPSSSPSQTGGAQPAPAPTPAVNVDTLVSKIQKFYDSTRDLDARFDQVLESGIGGKK